MSLSRREFLKLTSSLAITVPGRAAALPFAFEDGVAAYQAKLLPTRDEIWSWELAFNKFGPTYTGNKAHVSFVEFLASELQASGLEITRDHYTFTRWNARRWGLTVTDAGGKREKIPISSYYPYSGETPARGVSGELVHVGTKTSPQLSNVRGKIALLECPVTPSSYFDTTWGTYGDDAQLPVPYLSAIGNLGGAPQLTPFREAGALAVVAGWTNVSDGNVADQYIPFARPLQHMPTLWVARSQTAKLTKVAGTGVKATLVLEADVIPNAPTDTLIATLPGHSLDEVIVVNTHTDGPNAANENGGIAALALARYFSRLPRSARKRTLVFVLATGQLAEEVPSIEGFMEKHPDLIKKTVGALTVEHLGCREWRDDTAMNYKPTGKNVLSYAISQVKSTGALMLESLQGSGDRRVAVVNGRFHGEGAGLARAGVPTIGYIPLPEYLLAAPANRCIDKLSPELMHSQIEVFAKVIHRMDSMSAEQLRAG